MTRIGRLAAGLDQPLLVTGLVNVRYLTGFVSSNAALLVDPAGDATLHTDFRYAEAARQVEGVTLEETPRSIVAALADRLSGRRIAVEAAHLTLAGADTLRGGGVELVGTAGVVEALRAVKEPGELELMRRAAAISDRVFEEPNQAADLERLVVAEVEALADGGLRIHRSQETAAHVRVMRKIAADRAVAVEWQRDAFQDRFGEDRHRQVGPQPRPVDAEEPQAHGWHVEQVVVIEAKQLACPFRSTIRA